MPSETHPGFLHSISRPDAIPFAKPLLTFEYGAAPPDSTINTLIFLGGLGDGLLTVPFVPPLVAALPPQWSCMEVLLPSAYRQWGFSSLGEDIVEISTIVEYARGLRPSGKIVLLGHSTGCQQAMHYLLAPSSPKIDGAIFQSSVSDREAIVNILEEETYNSICATAKSYVDDGRGADVLPFALTGSIFASSPISANRWLSLASPGPEHAGEDDYYSSDLGDERLEKTFGALGKTGTRFSFLLGESDEYVPSAVDKRKLVWRWHEHLNKGGAVVDKESGILDGASHTLKEGGEPLEEFVRRVKGFLDRL
ncbi:hypothetical protein MMC21_005200 [Puttea exsequens]|nr:hypothetical protein [Puttea exsequens]